MLKVFTPSLLVAIAGAVGCATAADSNNASGAATSGAGTTSSAGGAVGSPDTSTGAGRVGEGGSGEGGAGGEAGAGGEGGASGGAGGAAGGSGGNGVATGGAGGEGGSDGGGGGVAIDPEGEVFAHSATTLFKLNPTTKEMVTVADFVGSDGDVIDIAVDKSGQIFGVTVAWLLKINKTTAACTILEFGDFPKSLSFVPAGVVDAAEETLVGYKDATYYRIDQSDGNLTSLGSLDQGYVASGDVVVGVGGTDAFVTVTGAGCSDCLIQIDPATGAYISMLASLEQPAVWGLGYWNGFVYGFTGMGTIIQVDLADLTLTDLSFPTAPANLSFVGAGSPTSAP